MAGKVDISQAQRRVADIADRLRDPVLSRLRNDEVRPIVTRARQRANRQGKLASKAGSTIRYKVTRDGALVTMGGAGFGGLMFAGSEYGGQKRRTTYTRRSKNGKSHLVRNRRSTMMFKPHLGRRGYFYWPTVRSETKGIVNRMTKVVDDVVTDAMGG